jgi:transcriptional regulator with XRE-family HTH domain
MATQSEAFGHTVKFAEIRLSDLAHQSGVSRSYLTEFRKGTCNPTIEIVERLLAVMELQKPGSRRFFYLTCAGGEIPASPAAHAKQMSKTEVAAYFKALSNRIPELLGAEDKQNRDNKEKEEIVCHS